MKRTSDYLAEQTLRYWQVSAALHGLSKTNMATGKAISSCVKICRGLGPHRRLLKSTINLCSAIVENRFSKRPSPAIVVTLRTVSK